MTVVRHLEAARAAGKAAALARRPASTNPYPGSGLPGAYLLARAWTVGYGQGNPITRRDLGDDPETAPEDVDPA